MKSGWPWFIMGTGILAAGLSAAPLPEGFGLSAQFPGDRGLARHPAVLLAEDFENGEIPDLSKRWSDVSNKGGKVLAWSADKPAASAGARSLQMTATMGENTGGHLYRRLARPADKVFARFYVKFAEDAAYIHHFAHLGGYNPPTGWPQGGAGERPKGHERMTVGIEPYGDGGRLPPPGAWGFYAYWQEMKISGDGKYWGNGLRPARPALIPRHQWQCVEVMFQANSAPEKADGELAFWVDGRLAAHFFPGAKREKWTGLGFQLAEAGGEPFEGFRWRSAPELKINFFWLLHYVTENAARQNRVRQPNPVNRVWFDDIVVATEYIGPLAPRQPR